MTQVRRRKPHIFISLKFLHISTYACRNNVYERFSRALVCDRLIIIVAWVSLRIHPLKFESVSEFASTITALKSMHTYSYSEVYEVDFSAIQSDRWSILWNTGVLRTIRYEEENLSPAFLFICIQFIYAHIQSRYFVCHENRHCISLSFIQFRMDTIKIGLNCNGFMKGKSTIHIYSEVYSCLIMCKLHILSSHAGFILRLTFFLFEWRFDQHSPKIMKEGNHSNAYWITFIIYPSGCICILQQRRVKEIFGRWYKDNENIKKWT